MVACCLQVLLQVGHAFCGFVVPAALDFDLRRDGLDLGKFVGSQFDVGGADVFFEPVWFPGAGVGTIHGFWASSQARAI